MFKRLLFPVVVLALGVVSQPREANATLVTAVECSVNIFPCPAAFVIDAGSRANGVGLLGPNQFTQLPFVFNNNDVIFAGNVLVTDLAGLNVYVWGGGAAANVRNNPLFPGGFYLDVAISQNYVTAPGVGLFSEFNRGTCTNNTIGTASGVAASLGVNGGFMPIMGNFGDCVAGGAPGGVLTGFDFGSGPFVFGIGGITNLTAVAQFFFDPAGGVGQSIDLPWGEDFPDIGLPLPDPGNIGTFGLTDPAPEPATFAMIGGALCLLAYRRRRK
jgi:hypothetical protein